MLEAFSDAVLVIGEELIHVESNLGKGNWNDRSYCERDVKMA